MILCTACSVLPLLYSQPRVAVCVHKQLHVHELSDGGVIEDKDAFKEDYIDWGQRRYDRVIGVAICTSRALYVYMGVSISLLYPPLFGPELPPYNLPQLFQRFRSLYPWPSRLWVAKHLTFTTFRILLQYAQLPECNYVRCLIASGRSLSNLLWTGGMVFMERPLLGKASSLNTRTAS